MKRSVVIALITAFCSSTVFAEESLVQAGARAVQSQVTAATTTAATAKRTESITAQAERYARTLPGRVLSTGSFNAAQQGAPVLSQSGLRRRTKAMLFISLAAGFAASAWVIDHKVQDITPSSLGTRED